MTHLNATSKVAAFVAATVFLTSTAVASAHARPADPDARTTNVATATSSPTADRSWALVQIGYRAKLDRTPS